MQRSYLQESGHLDDYTHSSLLRGISQLSSSNNIHSLGGSFSEAQGKINSDCLLHSIRHWKMPTWACWKNLRLWIRLKQNDGFWDEPGLDQANWSQWVLLGNVLEFSFPLGRKLKLPCAGAPAVYVPISGRWASSEEELSTGQKLDTGDITSTAESSSDPSQKYSGVFEFQEPTDSSCLTHFSSITFKSCFLLVPVSRFWFISPPTVICLLIASLLKFQHQARLLWHRHPLLYPFAELENIAQSFLLWKNLFSWMTSLHFSLGFFLNLQYWFSSLLLI